MRFKPGGAKSRRDAGFEPTTSSISDLFSGGMTRKRYDTTTPTTPRCWENCKAKKYTYNWLSLTTHPFHAPSEAPCAQIRTRLVAIDRSRRVLYASQDPLSSQPQALFHQPAPSSPPAPFQSASWPTIIQSRLGVPAASA
jgi:hypothetical protein